MKNVILQISRKLGYDIYKRDARFHPEACAAQMAKSGKVHTILDVGANIGQYAVNLRKWGYRGNIISFEPLTQAYQELSRLAEADPKWKVGPRCAIGAEHSRSFINISAKSVCSSLLEMRKLHEVVFPGSEYTSKEEVEVRTLDEILCPISVEDEPFYLKIDTQGYEKLVLKGAPVTLGKSYAVQLELCINELYEGSFVFHEGVNEMKDLGFRVYAIYPGSSDKDTGESIYVDAVFVR